MTTSIIEDVGEIIGGDDRFIKNIFYVQWSRDIHDKTSFREEYVVGAGTKQYRVRAIESNEFSWIYSAISQERQIKTINVRTLRAVASRDAHETAVCCGLFWDRKGLLLSAPHPLLPVAILVRDQMQAQ
ncbi:hypothetical protein IVA96_32785 [Bradyrhizobium sp. 159]|uniref:hypothetical protein n=1 Tax=Bradyrhizobium sp. 159 TaxID=2782632 RepID=UPI001FF79FDB|nr:hypothetical protein [Bradyrhizobium sp. 159]MCK1621258.1 hypothetical protein [Bradyrhizobium sp. 159]